MIRAFLLATATVARLKPRRSRSWLNGAEFTATAVRAWLPRVGVKTLFIEPGSLWENG
jgi:transposase InsO family protein